MLILYYIIYYAIVYYYLLLRSYKLYMKYTRLGYVKVYYVRDYIKLDN